MMTLEHARIALKKYFGYDSFRPLQAEIIQAVYDGTDTLVLMPTGGGKSLCFQLPAVTLPGITLVLSPLIALMKDQVEGLRANGVPASFMNSSLPSGELHLVEEQALKGELKLLYVSPEKLVSQSFQPLLKRLQISLIAIDEAHCISAWGHDFRPEYTQLRFLKDQFPHVPLIALTATADKLTRKDIADQLQLHAPRLFVASFDRPNLSLQVRPGQDRYGQIIQFLHPRKGQSGIIYCLSRRSCEELATKLCRDGHRAAPYHAELPARHRSQAQEDFINDRTPIICATIAFGMGIDKSNVRFIIHYNLPRNLEGYYQEIGRAGRDGLPADTLLFFSYGDVTTYRQMIEEGEASEAQKALKISKLERMYQFAEAPVCRRVTVLNYFGETYEGQCGNCDVCDNPPQVFDGATTTQKALSAILRCGEKVGMQMLVDVLRGSGRREILEQGFHTIKTYGAGKEYSFDDWMFLLSQMLHFGLIEMAYDDRARLRVTEAGRAVLFENKPVRLALPVKMKKQDKSSPVPQAAQAQRDGLLKRLHEVRRSLSQSRGVPPYLIFSDATLEMMADRRPVTDRELLLISGVGERKLQLFGDAFLGAIVQFESDKQKEHKR
jgi:ATP-dependent DNA helicase RecQ